jgi:hypothetical protein
MARTVRSDRQNGVSILVYFGGNDKFEFIGGGRSQHQAAENAFKPCASSAAYISVNAATIHAAMPPGLDERRSVPRRRLPHRARASQSHPVEDCYAGLQWLAAHAHELGINASRIAVPIRDTCHYAENKQNSKAGEIRLFPYVPDATMNAAPCRS